MKNTKFFAFSFAIASVLGITASLFSSRPSTYRGAQADSSSDAQSKIVAGETLLDENVVPLNVSIADPTTTAYGASFDLKFSTGEKAICDVDGFYNIIDETGDLIEADAKISAMDKDSERKEYYEKLQRGEIDPIVVSDCFIHSFADKNSKTIVVPRTVYRGEGEDDEVYYYYGVINAIGSKAMESNTHAQKLYIPNTIDTIPSDAFINNTTLQKIYCEYDSAPAGWAAGWNNGISVEWGVDVYDEYSGRDEYENVSFARVVDVGNKDINFIIGNFPGGGVEQPIVVEYKLKNSSTKRYLALEKKTKSTVYDGVGYYIYGYVNKLTVVIDLKNGEELDFDSIVVYNIFPAIESAPGVEPKYTPDLTNGYYAIPHKLFGRVYDLSEFIKITFDKVSTFGGYISVGTKIDIVNKGLIFQELRPGQYNNYKEKIADGRAHIRARFTSLPLANYRVKAKGVETSTTVTTPITQIVLSKYTDNRVNFMIKEDFFKGGFDLKTFEYFALENLTISLDVIDGTTIIKRTVAHTKFGCVFFFTPDDKIQTFDGNLFVILLAAGYAVGAALLSAVLFFVFKTKFKNDEFRRLKPKQFIKKAIIYSLTSLAVVIFLAFVILRTTVLLSSIVVYNPLDVFITIFGIATIIIVGYYVKEIVTSVRTNKQRKKALKLGLANDVTDDGTK